MKASARNQLKGEVSKVETGTVNVEVTIQLAGGDTLEAVLTKESALALGIEPGTEVLALIKAPLVTVVTDFAGYRLSARNQLRGTVQRIVKGMVNAEVVIGLAGGDSIVAMITDESLTALGIRQGDSATAVFKASAVIVAVATG